jgi:hypothetical protein
MEIVPPLLMIALVAYLLCKPTMGEKRRRKRLKEENEAKLPRVQRVNGKKVL